MKDICKTSAFIEDDDIQSVIGGASSDKTLDLSIFLFCKRCGRKTKMQMLSLHCAICETCRKTVNIQVDV